MCNTGKLHELHVKASPPSARGCPWHGVTQGFPHGGLRRRTRAAGWPPQPPEVGHPEACDSSVCSGSAGPHSSVCFSQFAATQVAAGEGRPGSRVALEGRAEVWPVLCWSGGRTVGLCLRSGGCRPGACLGSWLRLPMVVRRPGEGRVPVSRAPLELRTTVYHILTELCFHSGS